MEGIRKGHKPVTIERIKETIGYEHINEEEAQHVLDTLQLFAQLTYQLFKGIPEHDQKRFIRSI